MSSRHIRGKMKLSTNYTVTSGNYTIVNESLVVVDKTSGAATALTLPIPVDGQCIFIKDGKGDAATNNITISPDGATATTIDGAATYVISENYGSVMLEYDTTQAEWGVLSTGRSVADAELALLNGVTAGTGAVSKVMSLNSSGDYFGPNNGGIVVGHTAQLTVAGVVPELQVLGTTTAVDGSMALVTASTTNSSESQLVIGKGGNAALGSFTTVAQGENLGSIAWVGDDGVDLATVAARIRAVVNASGTVAASRVPTDLVISVDPGGADDAIAEKFRITCNGDTLIADGGGLVVGAATQLTVGGTIPEVQIQGTTTAVDGSMLLATASTTNGSESVLKILKGGNAALGSFTTVAQSENLGSIAWYGDDGVDYATAAAKIGAVVNASGTVAASRIPTDLVVYTDPGGADDAIAEHSRFGCSGILHVGGSTSNANMTKGITIQQATADNHILAFKSSTDVSHGVTDLAETDTYGAFLKAAGANGGLQILGLTDVTTAMDIYGVSTTEDTTDAPSTSSGATLILRGAIKSGTGVTALGATGNLLNVMNTTTNEFVVKGDGELYSNQSATVGTFDDHDDAVLCADLSYVLSNEYQKIVRYSQDYLTQLGILTSNDDGMPGMYSVTKMLMLSICAIGQLGRQINTLAKLAGVNLDPNGGLLSDGPGDEPAKLTE